MNADKIMNILLEKDITYILHQHPPVYTVAEAEVYMKDQMGGHFKNLLFRDKKNNQLYLLILPGDKKLSIKAFETLIGRKVTFAKEETLRELDTIAGAVSPFILLEDTKGLIKTYVDREFLTYDIVNFHPNDNSMTLGINGKSFRVFLEELSGGIKWID